MSGIVGVYHLNDRPVQQEDLQRMLDKLAHRGSDRVDLWFKRAIGLGHRMLWTTPESLIEHLPLISPNGNLILTADARIDNRDELQPVLQLPDRPLEKITDSEFILAAYEQWGEACPEHLVGDFAFAIWDQQRQQLFCARDHMGVKPFCYYHRQGQLFAFASEVKALFCLADVPRQVNETKIGDYLATVFDDKSSTFYQDIFHLPPACCATVTDQGIKIRSYWSLDPSYELHLDSDEAYAIRLREIFAEAVRCRLRSAFPVGSHLIGGLDSSSVTCMARQILQEESDRKLHTFSNIFDVVSECDERPFIEAVLEQGDIIPHFIAGDQRGPLSDIDRILWHQDGAVSAPTHFLVWGLNEAAQEAGVRIVLDGFDGDNTISHGEAYLTELVRTGNWEQFAAEVRDLQELAKASPRKVLRGYGLVHLEELARSGHWVSFFQQSRQARQYFKVSWQSILLQHGIKPLIPSGILSQARRLRGLGKTQDDRHQIIHAGFIKRIKLKQRIRNTKAIQSRPSQTEREQHWKGLTSGVLTQALEVADRYSVAFSIETRHPFMDKRLIEFCLSIPAKQKFHQSWSRYIMRRAMAGILPEKIRWRRSKGNMSSSFSYGLLHHNHEQINQVIKHHLPLVSNYVNLDKLQRIYTQITAEDYSTTSEDTADLVFWQAAMLAFWLQQAKAS